MSRTRYTNPLAIRKGPRVAPPLIPTDIHPILNWQALDREVKPLNQPAHEAAHPPSVLMLQSGTSLDTSVINPPVYPKFTGLAVGVALNVTGAPASTLTCDILFDGATIFPSSSKPTIASGVLFGYVAIPDRISFHYDTKIQAQLTATGSATGPLVVQILFIPGMG